MSNLGDYVYYVLVYDYLQKQIEVFQANILANMMAWASGMALVLLTLWIMIQGYRMITGQSRESMMALVLNMTRTAIIVTVATSMTIFGSSLQDYLSANGALGSQISHVVSGEDSPVSAIDKNMAATQLSLAAIDVVQVPPGDTTSSNQKAHAMLIAGLGAAGPAMAAGAMLLLYQFTMAIFIGLGPLFILCLIFEQTKSLFQRWLLYGIGTLFSIAVLYVVTSIVLKLTINVAVALWSADIVNNILDTGSEGFTSQAIQQGGIGLLMTVLIVSSPPLAAMFFQGTVGNFLTYSAFGTGPSSNPGPLGQPPGSYGGGYGGVGNAPIRSSTAQTNSPIQTVSRPLGNPGFSIRGTTTSNLPQADFIKNRS
ncbi:type IV secretion system protein [Rhodanobacter caeni]|uniref:Type IV secretion system protein n=1 Tax=Rhodanobacter caeni TaxID=657654 RepID=A0ABP3E6Y7_9GAMM